MSHSTGHTAAVKTPDWRGYYEWEAGQKRFLPGEEPSEEMRVEFVFRLLRGIEFRKPLDAGCGNGYLAGRLAERAGRAWGTDLSLSRLRDTSRMFPKVSFCRASIFGQPFADRTFDLVSAVEVVEHLEEPDRALRELRRLSARHVLVTVPYRGPLTLLYCPHCNTPYYHDGHVQSFNEERLAGLFQAAGMKIVRIETYVPHYAPANPLARALPAGIHRRLRDLLVGMKLKAPTPPKYLGILAERE